MKPQQPAVPPESVRAKERVLAEREEELSAAHSELERIQGELEAKLKEVEQRAESLAQHEIRLLRREHGTLSRSAAALNALSLVGRAPAVLADKLDSGSPNDVSAADVEVLLQQIDALSERSNALHTENARLRDEVRHVRTEVDAARRDAVEAAPTMVHRIRHRRTTLLMLAREIRRDPLHVVTAILVAGLAAGLGYCARGQSERSRPEVAPPAVEARTAPRAKAAVETRVDGGTRSSPEAQTGTQETLPATTQAGRSSDMDKAKSKTRGQHGGRGRHERSAGRKSTSLDIFSDDSSSR